MSNGAMQLSVDDLDLCRQWFDATQDLNCAYLEPADYALAKRIYEALGRRVPTSITEHQHEPKEHA